MLAWITKDFTYVKHKVNIKSSHQVTIIGKYISFIEITLVDGTVVKPLTLNYVKGFIAPVPTIRKS